MTPSALLDSDSRHRLQQCLLDLRLGNSRNRCFFNAVLISFLWASLCRDQPTRTDWGGVSSMLQHAILHASDVIHLEHLPFLHNMFATWFFQWQEGTQGDLAEFAMYMLHWLSISSRLLCLRWEKRLDHQFCIETVDVGSDHMPITLRIPENTHAIDLQTLIATWCQEPDHAIGLTTQSSLVLLQVERYYRTADSEIKLNTCPVTCRGPVLLPFFTDEGLSVTYDPYVVVALTHHLGLDTAGHAQASLVLRSATKTDPVAAHTDDMRAATLQDFPVTTCTGILYWLCKADQVHLPSEDSLQIGSTHALDLALQAAINRH